MPRNPNWTHEEETLALDCYINILDRQLPNPEDNRIKELSELLRLLMLHPESERKDNFRTADAAYTHISRFADLDPKSSHSGRDRGGSVYPKVWEIYADRPEALRKVAEAIVDAFKGEPAQTKSAV